MIVKYDAKIEDSDGAWINSNGEIIYTFTTHEGYAKNFCLGQNYDYLYKLKYKLSERKFQRWKD